MACSDARKNFLDHHIIVLQNICAFFNSFYVNWKDGFSFFLLKLMYEHNQSMSLYIQIAVFKERSGSYHWRNIIGNLLNKEKQLFWE